MIVTSDRCYGSQRYPQGRLFLHNLNYPARSTTPSATSATPYGSSSSLGTRQGRVAGYALRLLELFERSFVPVRSCSGLSHGFRNDKHSIHLRRSNTISPTESHRPLQAKPSRHQPALITSIEFTSKIDLYQLVSKQLRQSRRIEPVHQTTSVLAATRRA